LKNLKTALTLSKHREILQKFIDNECEARLPENRASIRLSGQKYKLINGWVSRPIEDLMTLDRRYKTFWPRLGATFLDGATLAPLVWFDKVLWNFTSSSILLFLWTLIYQALSIVYSVGFLYFLGQTPGKMATGVLILDNNDQRLTLSQAILRNIVVVILAPIFILLVFSNLLAGRLANRGLGDPRFLMWFFGAMMVWGVLEFVTMLFSSKRRSIHDFIAGTVVVRQPIEERIVSYRKIRWALIFLFVLNLIISRILPERNMQFGNLTTESNRSSGVPPSDH